jgi:uncharacterized protein YcgI (DUF1989 family)
MLLQRYKMRDNVSVPPHRSCQTNLAEPIAPYGLSLADVPDVYNVFMNVGVLNNRVIIRPPIVKKDDYIDLVISKMLRMGRRSGLH